MQEIGVTVAVWAGLIDCEVTIHDGHIHVRQVAQPDPRIWLLRNDPLQATIRILFFV